MDKSINTKAKDIERSVRYRVKTPNRLLWGLLSVFMKSSARHRYNVRLVNCDIIKKCKEPFVLLSNHSSRIDYIYETIACGRHMLNFVAGHNEFYNSVRRPLFKMLGVIPKYLYQVDLHASREMLRVAKMGGNLSLFPEGIVSAVGDTQPFKESTGKFLKKLGLKVFVLNIKGGYATRPKHSLYYNKGVVEVEAKLLFDQDGLTNATPQYIDDILTKALWHSETEWLASQKPFKPGKKGFAHNIGSLLYRCPCCQEDFVMVGKGNTVTCTHCGASATMDGRLAFSPVEGTAKIPFDNMPQWWQYQHQCAQDIVDNGGVYISDNVQLLTFDRHISRKEAHIEVGSGKLWLDSSGLHFEGMQNDQPFSWFVPVSTMPSISFGVGETCGAVASVYFEDQYYRFVFDHKVSAKWACIAEQSYIKNKI